MRADFSYPEWFSPSVKKLISSILVVEPTKRATLAQIKTSEWFIEGGFQVKPTAQLARVRPPLLLADNPGLAQMLSVYGFSECMLEYS